ncbi:uncharacterized protein BYT42DRAFT_548560 [Radiomyces spectabilis]|uniref:uncharacterized protein n=1 Tax=Radiomyces spectabilis TaxID=64574 RepID=UPI0022209B47|nr:uncharacterized protein BYT42DRAFT_548560 [Radiomyces spectabilis]KAI8371744.1 hypothetical protein BYT42DRAFT_548560 [Radiomyces spectabilis]
MSLTSPPQPTGGMVAMDKSPSSGGSASSPMPSAMSPSQLRLELEQQLAEKENQLQESRSGIEKNVLVRQISQLQGKLRDTPAPVSPQKSSDSVSSVTSEKLRNLERDLTAYRGNSLSSNIPGLRKEKLLGQRPNGVDQVPSPTSSTYMETGNDTSTSLLPLPPPPTGSTPTKRRSKVPNTDRRNTDIEFATEIGQGLLIEVRKMHALLQEKEEHLRAIEIQKADLERAAEAMAKQLRLKEENEERLKEDTWNLELANQELSVTVSNLQQSLDKSNIEQHKLERQLNRLTYDIEQLKDREEKLAATMDNMKTRHEHDMSVIRRHSAGLQREKTDLEKQIEALNSELAIAKAQSRIARYSHSDLKPSLSAETSDEQNQDAAISVKEGNSPGTTPPPSPKQTPARNQALEVETLKTSLAHAHRMVSNLRSNLHREKQEKFELKKLLADSQEHIEQLQNDPEMWVDARHSRCTVGNVQNSTSTSSRRSRKSKPRTLTRGKPPRVSNRRRTSQGTIDSLPGVDDSVKAVDDHHADFYSLSSSDDESDTQTDVEMEKPRSTPLRKIGSSASLGFTSLSSELSQSQIKSLTGVDAQVNTDPVNVTSIPAIVIYNDDDEDNDDKDKDNDPLTESFRSLGDELHSAFSVHESPDAAAATHTAPSCTSVQDEKAAGDPSPTIPKQPNNSDAITSPNPPPSPSPVLQIYHIPSFDISPLIYSSSERPSSQSPPIGPELSGGSLDSSRHDRSVQCTMTDIITDGSASAIDIATQTDRLDLQDHTIPPLLPPVQITDSPTRDHPSEPIDHENSSPTAALDPYGSKEIGNNSSIVSTPATDEGMTAKPSPACGANDAKESTLHDDIPKHGDNKEDPSSTNDETGKDAPKNSISSPAPDGPRDPSEMISIDEANAMVKAAVAAAVAAAIADMQKTEVQKEAQSTKKEGQNDGYTSDTKRHTCDMSTNLTQPDTCSQRSISPKNSTRGIRGSPSLADLAYRNATKDETAARTRLGTPPPRPESPPPPSLLSKARLARTRSIDSNQSKRDKGKAPATDDTGESSSSDQYGVAYVHPRDIIYPSKPPDAPQPPYQASTTTATDRCSSVTSARSTISRVPETNASYSKAISTVTETMIGGWLWKYTRKPIGQNFSDYRHQRYFWIHPYTRVLYWSTRAPGTTHDEAKAKSAFIQSAVEIADYTPGPPGLPKVSLLIKTHNRAIKVTAPNMASHRIWLELILCRIW